jgi:hypothetical protein
MKARLCTGTPVRISKNKNEKDHKNSVPFDIYAMLINNPQDYAEAFKNALIGEFKMHAKHTKSKETTPPTDFFSKPHSIKDIQKSGEQEKETKEKDLQSHTLRSKK